MKTKLISFLVASLFIVGAYMFQQGNSSVSEKTSVSQNGLFQSQTTVSSAQKTANEGPFTVKGKVSISFE